jgi:hypothetical protein
LYLTATLTNHILTRLLSDHLSLYLISPLIEHVGLVIVPPALNKNNNQLETTTTTKRNFALPPSLSTTTQMSEPTPATTAALPPLTMAMFGACINGDTPTDGGCQSKVKVQKASRRKD